MPTFIPRPLQPHTNVPENLGPAFVVYLGESSQSGFFRCYSNSVNEPGAKSIAPVLFRGRLIKSFLTVQAARSTYQECLHTGILAMLTAEQTAKTVYIVTKGFELSVYTSRKNALV
ncbi:hypothetical protein BT96DRAFT_1007507 [Gymnopus androsaceus JB14]|uniref:Uncharacterized protein n=1 Tax=Gymnopus androsaceus JB14 TaxID=1447944 RepID=A0A6A4GHH5_9AGAR|nr:hypothetical protein BT96DRAFT_1007507 [Gymnopus androsaceus JB14]